MAVIGADAFGGSGTIESANPSWVRLSAVSASITPDFRARGPLTNATPLYRWDAAAVTDCSVSLDVYVASLNEDGVGPVGRLVDSATFYHARYNAATARWELYRFAAGATLLGFHAETLTVGAVRRVELRMVGDAISLHVGGVQRVAATDSAIAAGTPGLRIYTNGASNNAGLHLDNWLAETIEPDKKLAAIVHHRRQQGIA